ncbi:calcyclin-binding protein-like [Haliotis rufescens]|uniref:calcyclin-binding protein-like n=1 Tax=Haliotis rufescens TaxID=6454 RepID=UPI001EB02A6D|nr:calcyclin-binding protein-like [Haliotis rufescens]
MASIEELKKDIEELRKFENDSTRPRVQKALSVEIRKIESMISLQENPTPVNTVAPQSSVRQEVSIYTEPIKKYAWDQSDKFMKLYVTLDGVQGIPAENVTSTFTNRSVKLVVKGLNKKNHELFIARLCEEITPETSYHKVKTDCVLLMMKKASSTTWAFVTEAERKAKETKKPSVSDKEDPNASLMKMMQNMYEDGDDDMKRTIAKAWTEGRDKTPTE